MPTGTSSTISEWGKEGVESGHPARAEVMVRHRGWGGGWAGGAPGSRA
jgi:hypothetical protein